MYDFDTEAAGDDSVPGFVKGGPFLQQLNARTINVRPWPCLLWWRAGWLQGRGRVVWVRRSWLAELAEETQVCITRV
ncbi:uncharacterized protein METZ01_LOCUS461326 [marine metagenome]|uniref:Uncharacterized protein n=1 Tax=marine metagenome TaxID=408172 RepID=A0A383AL28_9ZZZZ